MAFNKEKMQKYKAFAAQMKFPENVEALGKVTGPDGEDVVTLSFAADRDIVKDLYVRLNDQMSVLPQQTDTMLAVAGAVHELAVGKAVMQMDLIGPKEIAALLTDGEEAGDAEFYAMLLMIMALKNALTSYADYRRVNK